MASTVIWVVKQPVASSFLLPSKAQLVTHFQLNKQPSYSLPLPLPIRKHPRYLCCACPSLALVSSSTHSLLQSIAKNVFSGLASPVSEAWV